ncbi:transposase [Streptomyces sp. NPDC047009]|uniref:transposase n=1 Tax=unclassified Streptomyces TaxID=2593676 RepID=UPI0033DA8BE9
MAEKRRKFTAEFREGPVRIVTETRKPVPEVAKDLGVNETTLGSWVSRASGPRGAVTLTGAWSSERGQEPLRGSR